MNVDECCAICAEPLEWTGVGICGHNETCSKCVARWRFVMKDRSCMVCKQECASIYITRFMGDYTSRLTPEQFVDLKPRANRGELYYLHDIEGFFDDPNHFAELKALCGYTHPAIASKCKEQGREFPIFTSWPQMKKFAETNLKMNFCDICVQSRKVFLCEQLLYSKHDLDKHMKTGDESGPLAESSFKGHPLCKFCRQRFYDSNELYKHMESAHEHCFLCRRERPGQYVYYRHYQELEDHFRDDHHLCPHPQCMEKKFVVFSSEHELKRHFAGEHGDELNMSRAQRRQALTIPVNLQFGGDRQGGSGADGRASPPLVDLSRPGVVIGGGGGVSSRHGRQQGGGMHHSRSEGQMQAALHASLASSNLGPELGDPSVSSVTFSAEDFPSVSAAHGGAGMGGALGRWTAAAGGGPSTSRPSGGAGSSGLHHVTSNPVLSAEHFPALPTQSKNAKKKMKAQQASLADQLRAQNRPVRVINRSQPSAPARPTSATPPAPAPAQPRQQEAVHEEEEHEEVAEPAPREPSRPSVVMYEPPAAPSPTRGLASVVARDAPAPVISRPPAAPAPPALAPDEFPSLPMGSGPAPAAPLPSPLATRYTSATLLSHTGGSSTVSAAPAPEAPPPPRPEDFPSLGQVSVALRAATNGAASTSSATPNSNKHNSSGSSSSGWTSAAGGKGGKGGKNTPAPSTPPLPTRAAGSNSSGVVTAAAASAVQPGGVSESLKAANRLLIEKIKGQLADNGAFGRFRTDSGRFMRGELGAAEYHGIMVELGLLGVAAELAALCPVPERRDALMAAHKTHITSPASMATPPRGAAGAGWMPPEAALAAAQAAEARPSWSCSLCTLINAPHVGACEACGGARTQGGGAAAVDAFPSLSTVYGGSSSGALGRGPSAAVVVASSSEDTDGAGPSSGKKKYKGTKITIGLGAGNARAAAAAVTAGPAAWGGAASNASSSNPALKAQIEAQRKALSGSNSQWAQSGGAKLARQINAINDAWERR